MEKQTAGKTLSPLTMYGICASTLVGLNIVFLIFAANSTKTVTLLKKENATLSQDQQIVSSSQELYESYAQEIEIVTSVFPDEETIPTFIRLLEEQIRPYADEYSVKFSSLTPIVEQEKLFLLLGIVMKTDIVRFIGFLDKLEQFPYMTHVTGIQAKTPDGFGGKTEISFGLKVYVKNPFSPE